MKKKRYYLEAVRVLAMLLVMFNHSPAFLSFQRSDGVEYVAAMALSMICKCAVSMFFMISGAVLLGKNESLTELFRKRIAKIALVLILISLLYYMKLMIRGQVAFSVLGFVNTVLTQPIFLPYWYLYSYLGFLVLLPFLRAMAQHLSREHLIYLIVLQFFFGVFLQGVGYLTGWWYCGYFSLDAMFANIIFYPIVGYGLDQRLSESEGRGAKLLAGNLVLCITVIISGILVYREYLQNGTYSEMYLGFGTSVAAITLFLDCRAIFERENMPEGAKKTLAFLGDKVFGIYLLEGFLGANGVMDVIYRFLSPYFGYLLSYMVEILIIFGIRLVLVTIAKQIPVLKKLL